MGGTNEQLPEIILAAQYTNYAIDVYDRVNDSRFRKSYRTMQRLNYPSDRNGADFATSKVKLTVRSRAAYKVGEDRYRYVDGFSTYSNAGEAYTCLQRGCFRRRNFIRISSDSTHSAKSF
ncbi:MAG: hypothetical protein LBS09_01305 [Bacteroidales bacterium]|nr:hypothetical protein [Bacteroidales bacterium]